MEVRSRDMTDGHIAHSPPAEQVAWYQRLLRVIKAIFCCCFHVPDRDVGPSLHGRVDSQPDLDSLATQAVARDTALTPQTVAPAAPQIEAPAAARVALQAAQRAFQVATTTVWAPNPGSVFQASLFQAHAKDAVAAAISAVRTTCPGARDCCDRAQLILEQPPSESGGPFDNYRDALNWLRFWSETLGDNDPLGIIPALGPDTPQGIAERAADNASLLTVRYGFNRQEVCQAARNALKDVETALAAAKDVNQTPVAAALIAARVTMAAGVAADAAYQAATLFWGE